jgi:recombination protein RecR
VGSTSVGSAVFSGLGSDGVSNSVAAVQALIDELGRLPGIGPDQIKAITDARAKVVFCRRCWNLAESAECPICTDVRRDQSVVCVVEEPKDVIAIERTGDFNGRYHVLHGAMSPMDGIGPDQIKVRELLVRLGDEPIREVILCTNPNIEGEATALYLARALKAIPDLTVTRLASGLPVGGDLEYVDEVTIGRALAGRRHLDA